MPSTAVHAYAVDAEDAVAGRDAGGRGRTSGDQIDDRGEVAPERELDTEADNRPGGAAQELLELARLEQRVDRGSGCGPR